MPTFDVAYARSIADDAPISRASFIGMPLPWEVSGTEFGRDIFRMTAGMNGRFNNHIETGLSYDFETRNHYTSHQLNLSVALTR